MVQAALPLTKVIPARPPVLPSRAEAKRAAVFAGVLEECLTPPDQRRDPGDIPRRVTDDDVQRVLEERRKIDALARQGLRG